MIRLTPEEYEKLQAKVPKRPIRQLGTKTVIPMAKDARPGMRKSKYGNRKVENADGKFDSEREYRRWLDLKLLAHAGKILGLVRQASFDLAPPCVLDGRKHTWLRYVADFCYEENGETVVEDCKGFRTAIYKLKRHLMKTVHGIEVKET